MNKLVVEGIERVQKPKDWDKWSVWRKSAWYQAHKDEILADVAKYGRKCAAWRWTIDNDAQVRIIHLVQSERRTQAM